MISPRLSAITAFARLSLSVAIAVGLGVAAPAPSHAATITVNTFAQVDATKCTLTNAINSANDDVNVAGCVRVGGIGADTIVLPTGTYPLTVPDNGSGIDLTGLPVVTTDITILGNGAAITRTNGTAPPFFRIFTVTAGTLTLVELTVSGGRIRGSDGAARVDGGGINVINTGSLALNTVTISDNHVGPLAGISQGGGIGARGSGALTVTDSTVINNSATAHLATKQAKGGGIGTSVPAVTITRSRVSNNVASADAVDQFAPGGGTATGGGVAAADGGLTLTFVTVSGNTASAGGGAQRGRALGGGVDYSVEGPGRLTVSDCTFSGNAALSNGGGSLGLGAGGGAIAAVVSDDVTIQRSAFVQNTAQADGDETADKNGGLSYGGAIYHAGFNLTLSDATLVNNSTTARPGPGASGGTTEGGAIFFESTGQHTLRNVTMTGNSVDAPAGGSPLGSGIGATQGTTSLQNSIVIGNSGSSNCLKVGPDALFVSLGHNINPASSCGTPVASDQPNVDPQFGALVDLGRAAGQYLPLLATSPAIDSGNPNTCAPVDQLGQSRIGCDIGAIERVRATATVAAILPSTRAGVLGTKLTAFVTVINSSPSTTYQVGIDLVTPISALFFYQTTDALNAPTGTINTPVNIPPNSSQTFFISVMPTAAFPPTELVFAFTGTTATAPSVVGLNTLLVSASVSPIPDLVALVATLGNNGIVDIPSSNYTGVFTLATVNLGASDSITVSTDTGGAVVPLTTLVCQTNSAGACLLPPTPTVTAQINTGQTPTFGFFVTSTGPIAFDPAGTRVFVRLKDATGAIRGGSSVAPRTVP